MEHENATESLDNQLKLELLLKIENLASKGAKFPKTHDLKSNYQEMMFDYELAYIKLKGEYINKIFTEITNVLYDIKPEISNFDAPEFVKLLMIKAWEFNLEGLNDIAINLPKSTTIDINSNTSNIEPNDKTNENIVIEI